jgi:hypothetical protein
MEGIRDEDELREKWESKEMYLILESEEEIKL